MPAKKPVAKKKPAAKRSSYSMQSQSQRNKVGRRALLFKSKAFAGAMILLVLAIAGLSFFIIQKKDSSSAATNTITFDAARYSECTPTQKTGDSSIDRCITYEDRFTYDYSVGMLLNTDISYNMPELKPNNPTDDSTPGPTRMVQLEYGFFYEGGDYRKFLSDAEIDALIKCSYKFKVVVDSQEKINDKFVTISSKTLDLPLPKQATLYGDYDNNFIPYNFYVSARNNINPKKITLKWVNNTFACPVLDKNSELYNQLIDMNLAYRTIKYSSAYNDTRDGKITLNSTAQNVPQVLRVQTPSKISTGVVKATYLSEAESGYPFVSIPSGGFAEYKINAQSDIKYLQINEIVAKSGSGQLAFKLNGQLLKTTTTINSNGIKEKVILPVNIPKGSNKTLRIEAKNAKMLFTNITMSQNNDASLQQIFR